MRSFLSLGLAFAFCIGSPVLLSSCGNGDEILIHKTEVAWVIPALDLSSIAHKSYVLPAVFTVTGKSLEAAMQPEAVQTIGRLKPEYEEALATDALNFTEVRQRC